MRVLVATGTILCVLLVALSASHAGEPGDLAPLIEAIRQGDKEARVDALWELGFMEDEGKPAVAAILPLLRDKDAEIRSAAITALQRIGLGPESLPAVVDALADTEVGSYAAQALAALGSSAVPVLVKALENRSSEARANAVLALTLMGPKARDAVPALLAAFKRESPENREHVARALGAIGPAAKEAVPALIAALDDDEVYDAAVDALWKIKQMPTHDAGALVALLRPGDKTAVDRGESLWRLAARDHAIYLLGRMGPKAREAIPLLAEALADPDVRTRLAAAAALWRIEKRAERVLPTLIATAQPVAKKPAGGDQAQGGEGNRLWAVTLLGEIGPQARQAVPVVAQALGDPDPEFRCTAAETLWKIERRPERLVPTLIALVRSKEKAVTDRSGLWPIRDRAAKLLGEIGPEAREAVPALIEAIRDPDSIFCASAIEALGGIGIEAKRAIPAIVEHLGDQRPARLVPIPHGIWYVGETAWIALGHMGPDAAVALIPALKHQDKEVRIRAALALHELGPQAKPAVAALGAALKDLQREVRRYAARALGAIGPEARAAIPSLEEARRDQDEMVRQEADEAIRKIRPGGQAFLPAGAGIISPAGGSERQADARNTADKNVCPPLCRRLSVIVA